MTGEWEVIEPDSPSCGYPPPIAAFTPSVTSGMPTEVQFTDMSTREPVAWHWDFGDGTESDEQNPTHIYENYGVYIATLCIKSCRREHRVDGNYRLQQDRDTTCWSRDSGCNRIYGISIKETLNPAPKSSIFAITRIVVWRQMRHYLYTHYNPQRHRFSLSLEP